MRTLLVGLLFCASATAAASAQSSSVTTTAPVSAQSSSVTTIVERDRQGRVSIITSRSEDGTARTEFIYTPTGSQETRRSSRRSAAIIRSAMAAIIRSAGDIAPRTAATIVDAGVARISKSAL